jgi:D-glycero-alpha-D-manno-heptose-7-phosphate kinase
MAITIRQGAIGNWNAEFAAIAFSGFLISIGALLMDVHWQRKKERSGAMSNQKINEWYDYAIANGALGGKLIGAGGGGFLMFYAKDKTKLRHAMREKGLVEVRFNFDFEGTRIVAQS